MACAIPTSPNETGSALTTPVTPASTRQIPMSTSPLRVSMDDRSPEHDRSPDYADMYSTPNSMGNVTDTMARPLKSFLRISVALVLLVGLSVGSAVGQNVFNVTGGGGTYDATEFQQALNDATARGATILVRFETNIDLNTGQAGLNQYTTGAGGNQVPIKASSNLPPDAVVNIVFDNSLNVGTDQILLNGDGNRGVNLEFPEDNIGLIVDGSGGAFFNSVEATNSRPDANRLIFTGGGRIVDDDPTASRTFAVRRLSVQGGPVNVPSNDPGVDADELTVTQFLDVSGELKLNDGGGRNKLDFAAGSRGAPAVDVSQDAADLSVSGTISGATRFEIRLESSDRSLGPGPDARYTVEGKGNLEVPFTPETTGSTLDVMIFEQTSIGQFGFSNFGVEASGGGAGLSGTIINDVYFPFLEEVRASIRVDDQRGSGNKVEFGDPFPDPNLSPTSPNLFAGASDTLAIEGKTEVTGGATVETAPDLDLVANGDFEISGSGTTVNIPTTDTDPAGFTSPSNRIASASSTPLTANGDVTLNDGQLNLRAPGPADTRVRSEINGTLNLRGGTIALEDETAVTSSGAADGQGLHNISINGDANFQQNNIADGGNGNPIASGPADPNLAPLAEPTVFIGGSSGTLDANVDLDVQRLVIDGTSELTGNGDLVIGPTATGSNPPRIFLKDGIFTSNGSLDASATGVELIRIKDGDGHGQLRAGANSAVAYSGTLGDQNGDGQTDLAVPERVEYQGSQSISTGNELVRPPEDSLDRQIQELAVNMEQNISAVVTLNPDYTVLSSIEVRNGDLSLGSATVRLVDGIDFVRGNGDVVESPQRDLVFPNVADSDAGTSGNGINLQYVNNEIDIEVGVEWPTTDRAENVVRSVQIDAGGQEVALADRGNGVYRTNNELDLNGNTFDVNGQTIQHSGTDLGSLSGGNVDYDDEAAMTDSGDDGLFQFIGGRRVSGTGTGTVETNVNATTDEDTPQDFPFPETEVDKDANSHVTFDIVDSGPNTGNAAPRDPNDNGFTFEGDFTISDAQNFDGSGDTDVPAGTPQGPDLTRVDGVQFTNDVFQVAVQGSFVQEAGSFGANPNTLVSLYVGGSLTKTASDSSRFLATAETFEVGVGTTSGPDSLVQESGTFEVNNTDIAGNNTAPTFTVEGDLENSSPDALSFTTGGTTYSSIALQVDEGGVDNAAFEVTGDVTQTAGVLRIGGPRQTTGATGYDNNGSVEVGGSFVHEDGTTSIPNASAVDVANDVTVTAGNFRANLSDNSGVTTPPDNTFGASTLTVGDSTDASGGPGGDFTNGQDVTFAAAPGPSASGADNDVIEIAGEVSVQFDAQLALGGQALQTEGDFEFLGAGDQLEENNDDDNSGLVGTVRIAGSADNTLSIETDGTPDTFLNGLVINRGNGDVELASNVQTNRIGGAFNFGNSRDPQAGTNLTRPFGTVVLERGDIVTGEDTLTVREPTPTSGGDLLEAINADEVSPPRGGTPNPTPVLRGSRSSHVVGALRRALDETTANTGGFVEDGYVFPTGDGEEYRGVGVQAREPSRGPRRRTRCGRRRVQRHHLLLRGERRAGDRHDRMNYTVETPDGPERGLRVTCESHGRSEEFDPGYRSGAFYCPDCGYEIEVTLRDTHEWRDLGESC